MIPETIYSKYSQAMFDIASEQKKLTEFGTELKGVRDTFQENPDLWKFLNHPLVPPQSKKDTLAKIFKDSLSPIVLQFMYVMIDRRREAALLLAIDGFIDLARKAQHIEVAKIRVVKPLSKKEETKLLKIQKQYRSGEIKEEELTEEQVKSLCELYDKQIANLRKSNEIRKQKLLEYRKKLQTDN